MSQAQLNADIAEVETAQQLEKAAAKQLLAELFMIQRRIYGIAMNSMLIVQLKQLTRGLITKYRKIGMFENENIEIKLIKRTQTVEFVPTPHLKNLFNVISEELAQEAAENIKKERLQQKVNEDVAEHV